MKKVGVFEIRDGALYGPAQYMKDQGDVKLAGILSGKDAAFAICAPMSPDIETAILVALQTDYAGWKGLRQLLGGLR